MLGYSTGLGGLPTVQWAYNLGWIRPSSRDTVTVGGSLVPPKHCMSDGASPRQEGHVMAACCHRSIVVVM